MDSLLHLKKICKSYNEQNGKELNVLEDISFQVNKNEYICIVGPSGCGKTTLLEIIADLQKPTKGSIEYNSDLNYKESLVHPIIVFQEYSRSLYPFLTVSENIRFALEAYDNTEEEIKKRIRQVLSIIKLSDFADYYPWQLSGGMQQRVAIARALALKPPVLLLDEPFASLDKQTQYILEDEIRDIVNQFKLTVLHVTHDIDSAVYCSDRVLVFSKRPARLLKDIKIELEEKRAQDKTRKTKKFTDHRTEIYRILQKEIDEKVL